MQATASTAAPRSGNPAFNDRVLSDYLVRQSAQPAHMTLGGTALRTLFLLVVLVATGWWGWVSTVTAVAPGPLGDTYGTVTVTLPPGIWLASLGALFVGIATAVSPPRAAVLGIVYALLEGYVLGAVSAAFDAQTEGAVAAAVLGTLCVFVIALFLYVTRIVRPTAKMAFGVIAGMGGLALFYMVTWLMSLFGVNFLFWSAFSTVAIAVNIVAIVLAALCLTLDFGTIEAGVTSGAPRFMEAYAAYGLMVTLIWLYVTILRLIAILGLADR
jgi:uncharacterized YccA/Bax inhibitor family protein